MVIHYLAAWPFLSDYAESILGTVIPGLYGENDDGIPTEDIVKAANHVLGTLNPEQLKKVRQPLDSPMRRAWSNPELYVHRFGVRLDEVKEEVATAVLDLFKITLSTEGYEKAIGAMRINHFLGEVFHAPGVLNRFSYNFLLFGTPSTTDPWGWLLYGHHLCLSVFIRKAQIVLTPTFTGAEPNMIDEGPFKGTVTLKPEADIGLQIMQRLPPELQQKAQIFKNMVDLPESRFNPADQRHLCGAFQDNRIVPYEGINVGELDSSFSDLVLKLVEQFQLYLPPKARANRLEQVRENLMETYFCWIGGYGDHDPFYYRLQSPVIICELDHHDGVFLTNKEPAKFHIHTICRSPNGGDYGYALL